MRRGEDQPPHKADPGLRAPRVVRGLQDRQDLNLTSDLSWDKLNNKLERRGPHPTLSLTCRHKLDRLDLEDLQVCEDHLDLKGSWDRRETPETRDLPAPSIPPGHALGEPAGATPEGLGPQAQDAAGSG